MKKTFMQFFILVVGVALLFIGCIKAENSGMANEALSVTAPASVEDSLVPMSNEKQTALVLNDLPAVRISIENASMEISDTNDPSMPGYWSNDCWGKNKAKFSYLKEWYSGSRSLKTEVTNYKDGDAKWYFDPVKIPPGDYVFSDYYRSNADTRVVLAVTNYTGETEYLDLPNAPASKGWKKYEASFSMPNTGETLTVYHLLSKNGYLISDDYNIESYTYKGFDRGLITITFDDAWEENTLTALPVMKEFGYVSNQFYTTMYIKNPSVKNPKELIRRFIDAGHEIGSHSVTHPDLTTKSNKRITAELAESKSFLEKYLGVKIKYFASPFGSYNLSVKDSIMKYYTAHRTVDVGYNSRNNFDTSRLKVQNILSSTTSADVVEWCGKAKKEKLWLILVYHRVADHPGLYDTAPEMFLLHMQAIKDAGLPVVTFTQALVELQGQ